MNVQEIEEGEIRTGILKERLKLLDYAEGLVLETCIKLLLNCW